MTFGERLKHWIRRHYSSQKKFANIIGVSRQTLTNYITGISFPKEEFLKNLSDLGCSVNYLLTGTGDIYADNEAGKKLRIRSNEGDIYLEGLENKDSNIISKVADDIDDDEENLNKRLESVEESLAEIKKIMQSKLTSYSVAAGRKKQ